jgi:chromosome segregation ATPase
MFRRKERDERKEHLEAHDKLWRSVIAVHEKLDNIIRKESKMVQQLQDIKAGEAALRVDLGNVKTLIGGLSTQIADLQAQIAAGTGITEEDLQPIADSLKELDSEFDAVAPDAPPA